MSTDIEALLRADLFGDAVADDTAFVARVMRRVAEQASAVQSPHEVLAAWQVRPSLAPRMAPLLGIGAVLAVSAWWAGAPPAGGVATDLAVLAFAGAAALAAWATLAPPPRSGGL